MYNFQILYWDDDYGDPDYPFEAYIEKGIIDLQDMFT